MADRPGRPPAAVSVPDLDRLTELAALLRRQAPAVLYVDYRRAELDCELLAARLLAEVGRQRLAQAAFVPIPRGGLIVLGMLAYLLDLGPEQLAAPPAGEGPLVVVDDCALTGHRFAAQLAASGDREVVFAHLYSHPELRRAIVAREPRVTCCVAAHDLADRADESFPRAADRRAWEERWRARLGPGRYWVGQPDLVCFAWSEPDRPLWNPATDRIEAGWRFLPPHLCLGNRTRLVPPAATARTVEWRVPGAVVSSEFNGVVWLCDTRSQEVISLAGVAADLWRRVAGWGSLPLAATDLAAIYEVSVEEVGRDLADFVAELAARGLLERADG